MFRRRDRSRQNRPETPPETPPEPARALGYAGLIPFVGLAALAALGPGDLRALALEGVLLYGAIILSFMGGCRWGFASAGLGEGPDWVPLGVSVLPALLGWAAMWGAPTLGSGGAAGLLLLGFGLLYLDDALATARGAAPPWWRALRLPLTIGACASLAVAGVAAA